MPMTRICVTVCVMALAASAAHAQRDDRKTPTALLTEAARFENERQYEKAVDKAQKALDKAVAEQRGDIAVRALQIIGRSYEALSPDSVSQAQEAFARIANDFGDAEPIASWAKEKLARKGVDAWLEHYFQALRRGRDEERVVRTELSRTTAPDTDPAVADLKARLAKVKEDRTKASADLWGRIQPLDKEAVHGLILGLAHEDEEVRETAAGYLAEVIDEAGITTLIGLLSDEGARSGAALALSKVFSKFAMGKKVDDEAAEVLDELGAARPPASEDDWHDKEKIRAEDWQKIRDAAGKARAVITANSERAQQLRTKANEIRHNIPATLDAGPIQEALRAALADAGNPTAQIEASRALGSIGDLSGPMVEALLEGLSSKDRNVRLACTQAAGSVDTAANADKLKIVARLIEIIACQPEKQTPEEADLANEAMVRAAAALSLGRLGVVRAVPALIDALEDNSEEVRSRANDALIAITGRDFGYESEPHVQDPGITNSDPTQRGKMSEAEKRARQVEERKKSVEAWRTWWTESEGISTLVERFWRFAGAWKAGDPSRLYEREEFLRETRARSYVFADPADAYRRAERLVDRFQKKKELLQLDAVDAGAAAVPKLLKHLGGDFPELEKGLMADALEKARAATRLFVGETIARLAKESPDVINTLRERVGSGASRDERAGAALALGFLPKDQATGPDREALDSRGLADMDAVVREAAARALKNIGDDSNAAGLTRTAVTCDPDNERAQLWALRALAVIKPRNPETVKALGELVGFEAAGGSSDRMPSALVRELGCDALAVLGDAAAIINLHLIRARRDLAANVRDAAQRAIRAIGGSDKQAAEHVMKILTDEKTTVVDRIGAALAMGDLGQDLFAVPMTYRLVDKNAPTLLKDQDPGVRAAICRGLEALAEKARFKTVGTGLILAMETETASEQIRRDAYAALRAIAGGDIPKYDAAATEAMRRTQIAELNKWWRSAKDSWKADPQ